MTTKPSSKVVPSISKMLLENNRVRVYEVWMKPGEILEMHSHPDYVLYYMTDFKSKNTDSSGKVQERENKAGQAYFVSARTHQVENIGKNEAKVLVTELKK